MKKFIVVPWDRYQELLGKGDDDDDGTSQPPTTYGHEKIISTVPVKMRSRAQALLNLLSGTNISWTATGEVIIDGNCIKNSNICDLLKYVLCNYKTYKPLGFETFVNALATNNIPETLIQNIQCRLNIQQIKLCDVAKPWIPF